MIDVRTLPSTRISELGQDSGYFPVVATTTGSDVVIIYRAGAGHIGRAGRLECVRSDNQGQTWSPPSVVADSERDDRNPAIGVTHSGTIVVGYHVNGCYDPEGKYDREKGDFDTFLTRSHDGGATWETPYPLNYEPLNGRSPYGQMLTQEDGTLLMPIYGAKEGAIGGADVFQDSCSYLLQSKDEGKTWEQPLLIAEGMNETAFLALPSGEWLASLRAEKGEFSNALYLARAQRPTGPWPKPERFADPSRHPSTLALLGNGSMLMCYGYRDEPYGARAVISRDEGRTWCDEILLGDKAATWDCGYPSSVRLSDGTLVTAFYSVGPHADAYSCQGARCHILFYSEDELLLALGR